MTTRPFVWPVRVYYEDTDAQGVVYYAGYFRFMERARTEWLRALGIDQEKMMREERRIFVVTDTKAQFIVPARFNDELVVTAGLGKLTRSTVEIEQKIYRDRPEGHVLRRAGVTASHLDAETKKPQRVPPSTVRENYT